MFVFQHWIVQMLLTMPEEWTRSDLHWEGIILFLHFIPTSLQVIAWKLKGPSSQQVWFILVCQVYAGLSLYFILAIALRFLKMVILVFSSSHCLCFHPITTKRGTASPKSDDEDGCVWSVCRSFPDKCDLQLLAGFSQGRNINEKIQGIGMSGPEGKHFLCESI